jgi:hypothetical protein
MEKLIELIKAGYKIEMGEAFLLDHAEIALTFFKKGVKFRAQQIIPMDRHLNNIPDVLDFCKIRLDKEMKEYFNPKKA